MRYSGVKYMAEEKKEENDQNKPEESKNNKGQAENEEALKDRLLRLAAEFDNYKKRIVKDIDNAKEVGKAELIRKLLTVVDEFELAIAAMDKGGENMKGIELLFSNFIEILKSEGVKEIDAKGVFDPYKHEIMLTEESSEKEGTILEIVRKGYLMDGMMLRPVSVIVSKGSKKENKEEQNE